MTPRERVEFLADVEKYALAAGLDGQQPDYVVRGVGLTWMSLISGAKGPTMMAPMALGTRRRAIPLLYAHDAARPLGLAYVTPTDKGLDVEAHVADTAAGRDAVAVMRSGGMNGLSVGFSGAVSRWEGGTRIITRADLDELSVCVFPADKTARIASVDGQALPEFHAAPPHERETASAAPVGDVMAQVRQAERDLRAITGRPAPEPAERFDFVRGRAVHPSPVERMQRASARRVALLTAGYQKDPALRKLSVARALEVLEARDAYERARVTLHPIYGGPDTDRSLPPIDHR